MNWHKYELQFVGGRVETIKTIHPPTTMALKIARGDSVRDFDQEDSFYFGRHVIKCRKVS